MEMRKLVTFIRHESALLYAISALIENILILFHKYPILRDLSFLFNFWNLLYQKHWNALFIPLFSQFILESYLFPSEQLSLSLKMVKSSQMGICMAREFDAVTIFSKATTISHDANVSGFKTLQTQFYFRFEHLTIWVISKDKYMSLGFWQTYCRCRILGPVYGYWATYELSKNLNCATDTKLKTSTF